jgi:arsenate reductase
VQYHRNELYLVYDPHSNLGKQTKAMALDLCSNINEVDVIHERLSPTYWKEIVNMLGAHPTELLDHSHADYKKLMGNDNYTMDGWLEVLVHAAHLIKYPILVCDQSAVICRTPTDVMKLVRTEPKVLPHLRSKH